MREGRSSGTQDGRLVLCSHSGAEKRSVALMLASVVSPSAAYRLTMVSHLSLTVGPLCCWLPAKSKTVRPSCRMC